MILLLLTVTVLLVFALGVFLLGFQVGGRFHMSELQRVRYEAAKAERQLHDLTRDAFVAMAEHPDRRPDR
jgi:hypothetical protein